MADDRPEFRPIPDVTVTAAEALPTDATDVLRSSHASSTGTPDYLSADAAGIITHDSASGQRTRRRLTTLLITAGVTLTLLVGVGAYAAYQRLFDNGRPAQFTPASVAAFVAVDLDASLEQQIALAKLVSKFPRRDDAGAEAQPKALLSDLLDELDLTGVDVSRDLTSWLGLRAAFSLWLDSESRPYFLITTTAKDETRATDGLGRIKAAVNDSDLGFVINKGKVLIAIGERDAQQAADAAAAEASTAPLDGITSFQDAKRWLGDEQLVTVWMDMRAYDKAITALVGGPLAPTPTSTERGTSIIGIRVTDDGIEGRYRTFDAQKQSAEVRDAMTRLSELPANTVVGAVITMPDKPLSTFDSPLSPYSSVAGLFFGSMLFQSDGSIAGPPIEGPQSHTEAEMKEIEELLNKDPATLTKAEAKRLDELIEFVPDELIGSVPPGPSQPPFTNAEMKEIDELLSKDPATLTKAETERLKELIGSEMSDLQNPGVVDAKMENSLESLAGATVTLAITRLAVSASARLLAETASADAAKTLADLANDGSDDATVTMDGTTVTITSKDYTAGTGVLADNPTFRQVMAGAPTHADVAVYANIEAAFTEQERRKAPLRAIGYVQWIEGSEHMGIVRVLIG